MIFLVDKLIPKMFLFENVRGLLSARWYSDSPKGSIWKDIRTEFWNYLGDSYDMGWHLVRAKDYGVPQNRPRVLLVGIRKDLGWQAKGDSLDEDKLLLYNQEHRAGGLLPEPNGLPPSPEELLSDLVDPKYYPGQKETKEYPQEARTTGKIRKKSVQEQLRTPKKGRKVLGEGERVTEHEYSRHSQQIVEKFRYMISHGGRIKDEHKTKKFAQRVLPRVWENGEPTITATSLPDDYVHFSQPRILTVREWARLQMFPDWYEFAGKRTTGGLRRAGNPQEGLHDREVPKYTQIGNAVPVRMAEAVGKHFCSILDNIDK
jgi:DNA (cytosine-5)-methyltransferase 1